MQVIRNRIAHHRAVFDKRPMAEHTNMVALIGWICLDVRWMLGHLTKVPGAINLRPRL